MARGLVDPLTRFRIAMDWLQSDVSEMGRFIDIGESGLKSESEDLGRWYKKRTQGFSEEQRSEFADFNYEDVVMVRDVAPQMFRKACFVMLIGVWETTAANLVRTLHRFGLLRNKPQQKIYCDRSKKYLLDEIGFRKSAFRGAWRFCERAAKVRHIIIHNNSRLPCGVQGNLGDHVETARRFIKDTPHIHLSDHSSIELDRDFCHLVDEKTVECIQSLTDEATRIYRLRTKGTSQDNSGAYGATT